MKKMSHIEFAKLPTDYAGLVAAFALRPIHDAVDLENATEVADAMAGHALTRDQEDYFSVLATLIEQYERAHVPQPTVGHDALGNLKFLMEQRGMNASELESVLGRVLGQRELGSKVLRGERELSKAHIRKLAAYFGVGAGVFV